MSDKLKEMCLLESAITEDAQLSGHDQDIQRLRGQAVLWVAGPRTAQEDMHCGKGHVVRGVVEVLVNLGFGEELKKQVAQLD